VVKTHYGVRCQGIPQDMPNYVLKERHVAKRCENNAPVAAWCDDYVNKHLECGLYPEDDQYICKCGYVTIVVHTRSLLSFSRLVVESLFLTDGFLSHLLRDVQRKESELSR